MRWMGPAADAKLLGKLVNSWAPRSSQSLSDARSSNLVSMKGRPQTLAFRLSSRNARIHALADH
jgi:hypothetical protein